MGRMDYTMVKGEGRWACVPSVWVIRVQARFKASNIGNGPGWKSGLQSRQDGRLKITDALFSSSAAQSVRKVSHEGKGNNKAA